MTQKTDYALKFVRANKMMRKAAEKEAQEERRHCINIPSITKLNSLEKGIARDGDLFFEGLTIDRTSEI